MERKVGIIIGVLFGVVLIVVGAVKPAPLWNFEMVRSIRNSVGEVLTMVFLIGAGVVMIGSSLLAVRAKGAK